MDINQDINESIDSNEESSDGDGNSPDGDTKDISKKAIDLNENEDIRDEDLDSIKQSTDVSSKSSSPPFDKLPTSSNLTNKTIDPINISSFRNNINTPISLNDDSDFLDANDIDIETFDKNKSKNSDINSLNNSFDNNLPLDKYNISLSEDSDYDDEESDESSDSKISTDRKKSNSSINILSSSLTNNLSTFLSTPIASPMIRSRNNSNVGQLSSQEAPGLFSDLDFFKQFTTTNNTTTLPGFIRVPIVDMVDSAHPKGLQQELYKWYDVYKFKSSKNSTQGVLDDDSKSDKSSKIDSTINTSKDEYLNSNELIGLQIYLRLQLDIRDTDKSSDREVSTSLQQIFFNQPKDETKSNTSTISTLWNMVDHITYVQNLMSWLLDIIESFKNIFNWTNPSKTYPIYLFFIAFWIVSIMIPSRYIILTIGLHQFFYKFLPDPDGTRLVWWQNENDIRDNKPCLGQLLLLQPTASITQASPVDIKEMKDKDSSMKLISVFGCNENGYPLKCTILFSNGQSCQSFQNKVKSILQY
eukprot:gene17957-23586_t